MYFVMPHTPKMFFYLDIRTFVDVTWQNGSTEKNIPSTILKPISDLEAHDFFVHQYVVPNNSDKYEHVGVVKCVDHYEKTTSVRWIDLPNAEKIMSSCQLKRHPLYSYCNGNLVCRQPTKEIEISYLLCFGSIIGFKDGDIVVRWADGMASMVQPLVLHKIDGDDNYLPDSSESDETEVEDAMVIEIPEVEDAMVVEIPVFHVDFLDFVDLPSVECLNESGIHCISNDLEKGYRELEGLNLESIVDGQLLIYIPFKQAIKSHSLVIQAPVYNQEGPKTVKLFSNKEHFGFSDASEVPPSDTVISSEDNLKGKPVILKQVRFQNIHRHF